MSRPEPHRYRGHGLPGGTPSGRPRGSWAACSAAAAVNEGGTAEETLPSFNGTEGFVFSGGAEGAPAEGRARVCCEMW